ncbi:MAG: OsmC family peroxiredoxin [Bacteroidia bacterium]|nr:OsmC family peroxiredoxin [Bacteroidia bacterium]
MKRNATAHWAGGKAGNGTLSTDSKVLSGIPYTFKMRFDNDPGTNPEELIAAAHAGCFSMKLAINLEKAGCVPESIDTSCSITIEGGTITDSHIVTKVKVPGMKKTDFDEQVADAEKNCPVSRVLNARITVDAQML